jgi:hypothetical protein
MKSCVPSANKLWVTPRARKSPRSVHIHPHGLHSFYRVCRARKALPAKGFAGLSRVAAAFISYY